MNYNPSFNQEGMMNYNEQNPTKKIDITDAIILHQLYLMISDWRGIQKIKYEYREYCWVSYSKLLIELPALGYKNNANEKEIKSKHDVIAKRIKSKLINTGLVKLHVKKDLNSKTFWFITPEGLKVAILGKKKDESALSFNDKAHTKALINTRSKERQTPVRRNDQL